MVTVRDDPPGGPGFLTIASTRPQRDEDVVLTRVANPALPHASHAGVSSGGGEHAILYLAAPAIARRFRASAFLLADREATLD